VDNRGKGILKEENLPFFLFLLFAFTEKLCREIRLIAFPFIVIVPKHLN